MRFLGYSGHKPQKWCEECYLNHLEKYKFAACACECHFHTLGRDFIHAQAYTKTTQQ